MEHKYFYKRSGHWFVRICLVFTLLVCNSTQALTQLSVEASQIDTFNSKKFWTISAIGGVVYGSAVYGLSKAWYADFERTRFHFFNDWGEWNNMDKAGHAFTGYFESVLSYHGVRWAGVPEKPAVWLASGLSLLFQTTIEVLDGHSSKWGFSVPDMAYNIAGTALFTTQQLLWRDQKISLKISAWPRSYSSDPLLSTNLTETSTLSRRTDALFGRGLLERYLKDYNAQTIWVSVNPASFAAHPWEKFSWLNIAAGYGSENLFGGFGNSWQEENALYRLSSVEYPRYKQWFLAPDIDWTRIRTQSKLLKTVFRVMNVFKAPTPAISISRKGVQWYWLYL